MFESSAITTRDGYKYFGATKELKSVKQMFENQKAMDKKPKKPNRAELTSRINTSYYGFRDEVSVRIQIPAVSCG